MDPQTIISQFDQIYGPGKGMKMYLTVIPGILADIQKMTTGAVPGQTVSEEYILEDGRAVLKMSALVKADGMLNLTAKVEKR